MLECIPTSDLRLQEGLRRMSGVPRPDDLKRLFEVSPIAHVDKVKVGAMMTNMVPGE